MLYLTDQVHVKLADHSKDPEGILNTSRMSTTYRLLSREFKGQIPMAIISTLNSRVTQTFTKERKEVKEGRRSLRTYKQDLPIPIDSSDILHVEPDGKGEYRFLLYGLPFLTHFGRDASGNRLFFEKSLTGEYKLRNSAIEIQKTRLFLQAVFSYDRQTPTLSDNVRVEAHLSPDIPILAIAGEEQIQIGTREEYLYRRLAIQGSLQRTQATLRYSRGGKGRKKKLSALERFHKLEKNYVNTRLHQYSSRLIEFCLRHRAASLILRAQAGQEEEAKSNPFLLRNWTYYGLKEKISYKAARYGITVLVE
jgi:IS605 OrfB family transposase